MLSGFTPSPIRSPQGGGGQILFKVAFPASVDGAGEFEDFRAGPLGRIKPVVAER